MSAFHENEPVRLQVYLNPNKPRPVTCGFSHAFCKSDLKLKVRRGGTTNFPQIYYTPYPVHLFAKHLDRLGWLRPLQLL